MCVQLLLQFKCIDRFETCHTDAQVVYIQYSATLISVTYFSRDHRLLPMSHDKLIVDFNMILKFILSLFYVLHLNTSLFVCLI